MLLVVVTNGTNTLPDGEAANDTLEVAVAKKISIG